MKTLNTLLAIAISTATFSASATEDAPAFGLHFGLGFGGDTLAEVEFDDGSDQEVKAGAGIILGGFVEAPLNDINGQPIFAKIAFSYMSDSVNATNGDASFTRFPFDALLMTQVDRIKLGAGITYHLNPTYEVDFGGIVSGEAEFDNALGLALEANLELPEGGYWDGVEVGLRYTSISYKADGGDVDGSGLAITMGTTF
ncbi:hypothetical protein A9Q73_09940 [Bermanella sp. 47_1433_sub80_T6]|nr:hypothetical protein A9Q73_09940 [Bermanella sp. 47_1433_sub80_T6]